MEVATTAPIAAGAATAAPVSYIQHPSSALYVGNLASDVTDNMLIEKFNAVNVRVCVDGNTHRSLGYAYVNMPTQEAAKEAIDMHNATIFHGRPMRVAYSQRDPSLRRSGVGNLYVKGLAETIDESSFLDTLQQFGSVISVKISVDNNGISRGYGFVQYANEDGAKKAIAQLNGNNLEGKQVYVFPYKTKQQRNLEKEKNFTNVFVKNLPPTLDDEELKALFGKYGSIKRSTVRYRDPTRDAKAPKVSKGYGFVDFDEHESARAAIAGLNGNVMDESHTLVVERALSKNEMSAMVKHPKYLENNSQPSLCYVKHLTEAVTEQMLYTLFSQYGTIKSHRIMKDGNGQSKGVGFVCFETPDEAEKAIHNLNSKFVEGKPLYVAKYQSKLERQRNYEFRIRQQQQYFGPMMYPGMPNMMIPMYPQQFRRANPPMGRFPQQQIASMYGNPRANRPFNNPMGSFPQQPVMSMPPRQIPQQQQPKQDLAQQLAGMKPDAQKQHIGEILYSKTSKRYDGPTASRITGMLLELDMTELLNLVEHEDALTVKENESMKALNDFKAN